MATSARELVGWTEQRWTAVEEAAKKALARTAKCRQVIPIGAEQIGAKTVVVPTIATEDKKPIAYGAETVTSPIHIFVDAALDDQIADDEAAVCRLVEFAAAQVGLEEDEAVVEGVPDPTKSTGDERRRLRTPELGTVSLTTPSKARPDRLPIDAETLSVQLGGTAAKEIVAAVRTAQTTLEEEGRPGPCGLLLYSHLFATLLEVTSGGTQYLQQVEQFLNSNEIAGTSALDGGKDGQEGGGKSNVCGILFRLEPPAVDLVQTARPTVTVLGRVDGQTKLRVEEGVVLRILDQRGICYIKH